MSALAASSATRMNSYGLNRPVADHLWKAASSGIRLDYRACYTGGSVAPGMSIRTTLPLRLPLAWQIAGKPDALHVEGRIRYVLYRAARNLERARTRLARSGTCPARLRSTCRTEAITLTGHLKCRSEYKI